MNVIEFSNKIDPSSVISAMTEYFKQTMALYNMVNIDDITVNTDVDENGVITYTVVFNDSNDAFNVYTTISSNDHIYSYKNKFNCNYILNGNCIHISIFK